MASQITGNWTVCWITFSAKKIWTVHIYNWPFVSGFNQWLVDSSHKVPVMWKAFRCRDVIMCTYPLTCHPVYPRCWSRRRRFTRRLLNQSTRWYGHTKSTMRRSTYRTKPAPKPTRSMRSKHYGNGAHHPAAILGAAISVPCHAVKSLQRSWRLGTCRWNLWETIFKFELQWHDLKIRQEDNSFYNGHQGDML